MEKVKFELDMTNLEEEINEFKLSVHGDNLSKHRIKEEGEYVIIELYEDDNLTSAKDLFYGKIFRNVLYIARHHHIPGIEYDHIDLYDEFFGTGEELTFS